MVAVKPGAPGQKRLSFLATLGILLGLVLCGLILPYGLALLPVIFLLAQILLAVLFRRGIVASALLGSLLLVGVAFWSSGQSVFSFLSLAAPLGGFLLAYATSHKEDRFSATLSLSVGYFLVAGAVFAFVLYEAAAAAGTDMATYFSGWLDAAALSVADVWKAALDRSAALYAQMGVELSVATAGEVHTVVLRLFALAPGMLCLLLFALALISSYLMQLTSLLFAGTDDDAPLFYPGNAIYRLSPWLSGLYLPLWLVSLSWVDYTNAAGVVLQNTALVLTPLFAFGGVLCLPRIFRFMREMNEGRVGYVVWSVLFILLCLTYMQYAITAFAVGYAVYILYGAFRSHKEGKGN